MKLTRYLGGSEADEHTTELADMSILTPPGCDQVYWHWENDFEESRAGDLRVGLIGPAPAGSPPDKYWLEMAPAEVGSMLAPAGAPIRLNVPVFAGTSASLNTAVKVTGHPVCASECVAMSSAAFQKAPLP